MAAWGFFVRGSAQDVIGQIERLRGALPDAGRGKCRSHGRIYTEISFHGTQLLSPSACSTAKEDAAKDVLEMDSPGSSFLWNLATWNQRGDDLRGVNALVPGCQVP